MSQIKFDLQGIMIAAVSVFAAYSFAMPHTSRAASAKKADSDYVWIKYDCNNNGQVETSDDGNNVDGDVSNPFSCGTSGNICARKFLRSETQSIDANNIEPTDGATVQNQLKCDD